MRKIYKECYHFSMALKMTNYQDRLDLKRLEEQMFEHPRLEPSEERDLLERISQGDQEATNKLVEHHIRYVGKIAAKYVIKKRNTSLYFDIVHEGIIGLYDAAKTYDLRRGEKKGHRQPTFLGHAKKHIMRRIGEYLEAMRNACHVPRSKQTAAFKAAMKRMEGQQIEVTREAYYEFLVNPSNGLKNETMKTLRTMKPDIVDAFFILRSAKSYGIGSLSKDDPSHYLADRRQPERRPIDEREITERVKERVRKAVDSLSPAQREAIRLRYLDANMEQEEVGDVRGISHQAISCAEKKAMAALKEKLKGLEGVVA